MKRLILALAALFTAQTAFAAGNKPPDVQAFTAVAPTYASGTTPNTVLTSTPPAFATMPANIPVTSTTGMLNTGGTGAYCTLNGTTCQETKIRTEANITHILFDDSIRNYGQPGTAHCHEFYGSKSANAFSTYASLRNKPSRSAGNLVNTSAYWFPCPVKTNPFGDGKNYAVRANHAVFYYFGKHEGTADVGNEVYFPRGGRVVFGTNMDDPDDLGAKAEIATANAQTGTAGRYSYVGNGFIGWYCETTQASARYLANTDGSEAFACPAGQQVIANINSQPCWDRVNLWSPTGYANFRYEIRDNVSGTFVCPTNYSRVFQIILLVEFTHTGPADFRTWRLSSDNAAATASGHAMRNGESFHADYLMAWDDAILRTGEDFCVGAMGNKGHECNVSTLTATSSLVIGDDLTGAAAGPNASYSTATASGMFLLPGATYTGVRNHATH